MDQFNETLLAITEPVEQGSAGRPSPAAALDQEQELARAYARAMNCIRHHLAIDSLTTGMLQEMGIGSESVTLKSFRSGVRPLAPVGRDAP